MNLHANALLTAHRNTRFRSASLVVHAAKSRPQLTSAL